MQRARTRGTKNDPPRIRRRRGDAAGRISFAGIKRAIHLLKKSFDNGYAESAYYLGKWYANISEIKSMTDSVYWFMQGCDKDDPGCMIEMAKHLESGTYVKEDPARAMGLYRKLSETDDAKAIGFANLGRFHEGQTRLSISP